MPKMVAFSEVKLTVKVGLLSMRLVDSPPTLHSFGYKKLIPAAPFVYLRYVSFTIGSVGLTEG